MKHDEGEFKGVNGFKIYYQAWLPDNPKAVVQVVHGWAEHSGRYMNVVNELVPRGYAVYANDHRGHGKSEGIRSHVDSFDQYVEDEKIFNELIRKKHPNLPIFMLGHSMGSAIAIYFVAKHEDLIKGLILSGCGTAVGGGKGAFVRAIGKLLAIISPRGRIDAGLGTEFISRDPEVVKAYEEDPLIFSDTTFKAGMELLKAFKNAKHIVGNFKIPLLYQKGSADQAVTGSEELEKEFTMEDKTIKRYDGLFHEVYNELEKDRKIVLKDLGDWLDKHA
ncbi:MAG: lysophospholipase [Candidatus Helarchaeota archaeon]